MIEIRNSTNAVEECLKQLKNNGSNVVLYGAGYCGHEALSLMEQHHIPVKAVCDDFRVGEDIDGYTILSLDHVRPDAQTVIFITSGFNTKMKERLSACNLLTYYYELDFGRYDAKKENMAYFQEHKEQIQQAWNLLSDSKSRKILQNLVNYRISRDLKYLTGMEEPNQYFPPKEELSVVYGGGDRCLFRFGRV